MTEQSGSPLLHPAPPTIPDAALRRAPSRPQLAAIAAAVQPGSVVGAVKRLRGGVASGMHAVQLRGPGDAVRWVVVRRYGRWRVEQEPVVAQREWATLTALAAVAAPTPLPLWLDAEGAICGCPTIVTSRLPGRGLLAPRDPLACARGLAHGLAAIHAAPLDPAALDLLEDQRRELAHLLDRDAPPPGLAEKPGGPEAWAMMRRWWPHMTPTSPPRLVHGDYWPGNTLWHRGRLSGIVDWEQTRRGDPAQDVACCRLDLALLLGPAAADCLLKTYEAVTGQPVPRIYFWDLYMSTWATMSLDEWLKGYHDLGRTDLTLAEARARLARFTDDALARAAAALLAADPVGAPERRP